MSTAILMGQNQLMMDGNFRCMEAHIDTLVYPANTINGVTVAADYKCPRYVFIMTDGKPTGPLQPATEDQVNQISGTAMRQRNITDLSTGHYYQRWYEREQKICLMIPPGNDTTLRVDYYKILPAYDDPADTDYFSANLWPVLLQAAAWIGSMSLWQDDRAATFATTYATLLQAAIAKDAEIKQGGVAESYSPPLPGGTGQ
jgi:hypothetical protein